MTKSISIFGADESMISKAIALGMLEKALETLECTWARHRRIRPVDHPDIAMPMPDLALTYRDFGMLVGHA